MDGRFDSQPYALCISVIGLKILGFVRQAGEDRGLIVAMGGFLQSG